MPYDAWMETLLSLNNKHTAEDKAYVGLFDDVPTSNGATAIYNLVADAMNGEGILDEFALVKTFEGSQSAHGWIVNHCGMYATHSLATTKRCTDWASVEIVVVFKLEDGREACVNGATRLKTCHSTPWGFSETSIVPILSASSSWEVRRAHSHL
ncbi:hypothetical protein NUW54_g5096 [Trametes sanguinea]|uniref:Uncharacterized protein n=1 Tax=Trametes sanguinea TaxID=158606 RepID=A0ACC1PW32_9APHY|nr:hypothetical protein NUW54_g5096 [Trametes sanguinea]